MRSEFSRAGLKLFVLLVCLMGAARQARSTTISVPDDDNMIIGARAIIIGKVLTITCAPDDARSRIFTYTTLRVSEVLKGNIITRKIVIKEEGGQLADRGSRIFGTPQFAAGERVLLYLDTWPDGSLRTHQMFFGKFSIIADRQTGRDIVIRSDTDSHVAVIPARASDIKTQSKATARQELAAYREMVRARLRVNRKRAAQFESEHYSNAPLLAAPVEYDQMRARGRLQPQFTLISPLQPTRWFEPDAGEPVVFLVNPENAPSPEVMDDITAAMSPWSAVQGCSLRVANGGEIGGCSDHNGTNIIVFNNCDGRFAPTSGCSSIIAIGGLSWIATQTKTINGTVFVRATQGFISFNPYSACSFSDHCRVQEIATHELGHALGLGHSQYLDATMFGSAHFDDRCASIRADDADGITFLYPTQDTGGGPLAITTGSVLPAAALTVQYVQVVAATGGRLPYTWGLVPELGRLPSGVSFTTSGIIGGKPIETGTYNFTVEVRDADGTSVRKSFSLIVNSTPTFYDSQFVSQTVPTTLQPGQQFSVSVKWLNAGTQTWDGSNGFRLGSQNPTNNSNWGGDRVMPVNHIVLPGQPLDLTFTAFAPRTSGTYNFQWQLFQEGTGFFGQMSTNVAVNISGPSSPAIEGPASLEAIKGTVFRYQLAAAGGTPPYLWSVTAGTLPAGLSLNSNTGLIAGTPAAAGSSSLKVQVSDSVSRTSEKSLTINVAGPPVDALDIKTLALPVVMKGAAFNSQLEATGGRPPYIWTVAAGALPAGLGLDRASGSISGAAQVAGSFGFTIEVADADSRAARKSLSMTVLQPLSIEVASSVDGMKGSAFTYQTNAAGGAPPYTWSVSSGALPTGLSLGASTGVISGTPSASGTFNASITIRDQSSRTATANLQIRVIDPLTIPAITKVTYKAGKKLLTVKGQRFDPSALLFIDGVQTQASFDQGLLTAKRLSLAKGPHEIRVVNPNNISSQPVVLIVN
jgi:putative Ig domain-containing protein/matrixin